jgi:hypothetical protein
MKPDEDINIPQLITIGVVSAILLVEVVVGVQALFYSVQETEIAAKQTSQPAWELADLRLEQETELNAYRWVDQEKGLVAIPIDRAIDLYVAQLTEAAKRRDD